MEKQISQEELKQLQNLDKTKSDAIFKLGQIKIELLFLEKRVNEIKDVELTVLNEFEGIVYDINKISKELEEKYGTGVINLQTGVITPQ